MKFGIVIPATAIFSYMISRLHCFLEQDMMRDKSLKSGVNII